MNQEVGYAGFWLRVVAAIIDCVSFIGFMYLLRALLDENTAMLVYYVAVFTYVAMAQQSKWQGTLGYKILQLKLTDISFNRVSWVRALGRALIYNAPAIPFTIYMNLPQNKALMLEITAKLKSFNHDDAAMAQYMKSHPEVLHYYMVLFSLIGLMTVLMLAFTIPIAFTRQKTGVHDMIAKTRVIKA